MFVASVAGTGDSGKFADFNSANNSAEEIATSEVQEPDTFKESEKTTEEIVNEYFKETPILSKVAYCESRYRQFDSNGNVLRGMVNSSDVGVMQINEYYHLSDSKKLGLDIHTLEGNLAYAKNLYERQGIAPWVHSSPCWNKGEGIAMNQ